MQASPHDIDALLKAQKADLEILKMQKQLDELPQREVILTSRKRRESMLEKISQIEDLKRDIEKKRTRILDEDASLQKKENGVQAAIEAAGNDFRNAEARTRELDGIFKRRNTLSEELAQIDAELAKANKLASQAACALQEIDTTEANAVKSFKSEGGALKTSIANAELTRDSYLDTVDPALEKEYRSSFERIKSIVVGKLEGSKCGVCRTTIDSGRLIQIKSEAPLSRCPNCKRLLIVE